MTPSFDHRQQVNPAGSASLGIFANTVNTKSVQKPEKKTPRDEAEMINRKSRYQLQRAAQGLLPGQRVHHCQRSTMSGAGVTVYKSAKGGSFGNLATCGSVWHCPVCAARITEARRQELQDAINTWMKQGGEVYLMSLTFPHLDHQRLDDNLDKFADSLKKFKNSRAYKNCMKAIGSPGSIRALEVTHGANGWHPHTHDLIFAKAGQLEKLQELQIVWIEMLIKAGLADRSQLNDMYKAAFDVQNGDYAAEYVAKFGHEATNASKILTENTWGASHEMTKAHAKVGKRLGGRTPFTLLADYIKGDKESGDLFVEFGLHFKGKRQLFWSPKLRVTLTILNWCEGKSRAAIEAAAIEFDASGKPVVIYEKEKADAILKAINRQPVEKTDDELAAELPDEREFVTNLDHDQWKLILSRNARFEVLRVACDEGAEGVARLLDELAGRRRSHSGIYSERGTYGGNWHKLDA
jgi:hypothetical protein